MSASPVPVNAAPDKAHLRVIGKCAALIDAGVFSGLLLVIVFVVVPYGTVDPWWESAFECAVFALTALWIVEGLCKGSWQLRKLYIVLPLILMTIYAFGQTLELPSAWFAKGGAVAQRTLTIDRYQTYLTARKLLALTLFLSLILVHTTTARRFRWLVRLLIGIG